MISARVCHSLLILLLGTGLSCTQDGNPISPVAAPQKSVLRGKQRLHGYWKAVNDRWGTKFCVADTMISRFVTKQDRGLNFRRTIDDPVVFTDSTILTGRMSTPWRYYRFSPDSDTLFISNDSLYKYPLIAVVDSTPSLSDRWSPIITYDTRTWMQNSLGDISGADRYGDNWYLHHSGNQSSTLDVRNLAGGTLRTISFPGVTTSDIDQGFLWIAGNYFVEKRSLVDTTLIQRIDLSSHYPFLPNDYIFAMTVHDSLIYLIIEDHMLSFNTIGQLIHDVPSLDEILFITFVGDKLIAGTSYSTINTVDLNSGHATESYTFPESLYGDTHYPIRGIVNLGDRLTGFRYTPNGSLYLYEFAYPQ